MVRLVTNLVVCGFSTLVTVALTNSILTPLFYDFPKALLGWFRGVYAGRLPLFCLSAILIPIFLAGTVVLGAFHLLRAISPATLHLILNGWGLDSGIVLGGCVFLISQSAQSTRLRIKEEFDEMAWIYGRRW
jgi:hypothetical protein